MITTEISPQHDRQGAPPADGLCEDRPAETPADGADGGEVLWVDPHVLIIGDNVRTDVRLERGFVADIKDRGVRQIIPVHRDEQDRLVLLTGQKRVLAAIEAGLDWVRVLVERLITAARTRPEQFDHIAQQLRDDREEARLCAELTATLTGQGVRVIDRPAGHLVRWPSAQAR